MSVPDSPLQDLLKALPHLHPQIYFKSSLTALSHAIEDLVLTGTDLSLVIANFQRERFYRQEVSRYRQIAQRTDQVYVMAAPESNFMAEEEPYEIVGFDSNDALAQEWHLVVIGQRYTACLICREIFTPNTPSLIDQGRRFQGIWTFDRAVSVQVAQMLLERILIYRPELAAKVDRARNIYNFTSEVPAITLSPHFPDIEVFTFTQRLVSYLQASQYRLLKIYRLVAAQERKQRLINSMTTAIRRSLNPQEILTVAVEELGRTFEHCRCLLYRCHRADISAVIEYESVALGMPSVKGEVWPLADNPLFQTVLAQDKAIAIPNVSKAPNLQNYPALKSIIQRCGIRSWLLVPILYQETLLGMLELHQGGAEPYFWREEDISLVEAIATSVGVALIQAEAYTRLEEVNQQLAALERTRTNLIAIVGHELRTPLSTIQVCLESLASEPEMPPELEQVMLESALTDAERLRKLTQDFITLSRLESFQVRWQIEPIFLPECIDFAVSNLRTYLPPETISKIKVDLPENLPAILADGQGLVEVLAKLLDNACKHTQPGDKITIRAITLSASMLEIIVADTGRGIDPSQLEAIFDRFSQEEGYLRRLTGGVGLGLAICRRIIQGLGGQIWAESAGKDRGSEFHFTLPIE